MKSAYFSWPDTMPGIPAVATKLTPDDICGHYGELVARHYAHWKKHDCAPRDCSASQIEAVAECYGVLRENGYYPTGLDSFGRVEMSILMDSRTDAKEWRDLDRKRYSGVEIKAMRRKFAEDAGSCFAGMEVAA